MSRAIVAALIVAGCASMQVHSQTAPDANLARYHTFAWFPTDNGGPESIMDQKIRSALGGQLTQRGLRESARDSADLLVAYHVLEEHKVAVTDWGNGIYGWDPEVEAYNDGTLIVDFIDPHTNKVVWRGSASGAIEHPGTVDPRRLQKAATELVRKYPVQMAAAR